MTVEDLYNQRKAWVDLSDELEFDLRGILSGLYTTNVHFVYELLQNAEDVHATKATIELESDRLIFRHNAERKFDINDIRSISSIGASTKKNELNKIGKFGIGIKSIFAVADKFAIHSGGYSLEIKDFVVPVPINPIVNNDDTLFEIYFKDNSIFDKIRIALDTLSDNILLFLSSIEELTVKYKGMVKTYKRDLIVSNYAGGSIVFNGEEYYLLYSENNNSSPVKIAFRIEYNELDKDNLVDRILSINSSKFYCFFETDIVVGTNFIIHAPVRTTPSRDNIPFDLEDNKYIINRVIDLYESVLDNLFNSSLWSLGLIGLLPLSDNNNLPLFSRFYEVTHKFLIDENRLVLPVGYGKYVKLKGANYSISPLDMSSNFDDEDICSYSIVDLSDVRSVPKTLINYIVANGGTHMTLKHFCHSINSEYLSNKSESYMTNFYSEANNYIYNSDLPLIKTTSGRYIKPSEAYAKSSYFEYPEYEVTKEFNSILKRIVKTPLSFLDFVKIVIIPRMNLKVDINKYIDNLKVILTFFEQIRENEKFSLINDINNKVTFRSTKGSSLIKELTLRMEMHTILDRLTHDYDYIDMDWYRDRLSESEYQIFEKLLDELEINKGLKVIDVFVSKKCYTSDYSLYSMYHVNDIHIRGLENFLSTITLQESIALMKELDTWNQSMFQISTSSNRYRYYANTKVLDALKDISWIYDDSGRKFTAGELSVVSLNKGYGSFDKNGNIRWLGFLNIGQIQTKISDCIQSQLKNMLSGRTEQEQLEFLRTINNISSLDELLNIHKSSKDELLEHYNEIDFYDDENARRKAGERYQRIAMQYLRDLYIKQGFNISTISNGFLATQKDCSVKIIDMNLINEDNEGYDFLIEYSNGHKELVEVKGSTKGFYRISKSQYKLALQIHKQQDSSKYRVIFISASAGVVYDSSDLIRDIYDGRVEIIPHGCIVK